MKLLVTGAGGGIGASIVALAVERGHDVLAHDMRFAADLDDSSVTTVTGDLTDSNDLRTLRHAAETFGAEAVIAAHGVQGAGALSELTNERVRSILSINAASIPALFAALRPILARNKGRYVVITSQAALRAERDNAAYCASKWAVQAWVTTQEELESDISLRALCPGRTFTPLLDQAMRGFAEAQGLNVEDYTTAILDHVPLRRFASTRETAAAALYLAEPGIRPNILAETGGEVPF